MESAMSRLSLSLPLGSLLLALLSTRSPCAAPQPPLPAIDLPDSYYYRTLHRVRVHTGAGDGAVAARAGLGSHAAADSHGCGQRRAALVSRRRTDRLRVDGLPPALPRVCRRLSRRRARRAGASHGREPEP